MQPLTSALLLLAIGALGYLFFLNLRLTLDRDRDLGEAAGRTRPPPSFTHSGQTMPDEARPSPQEMIRLLSHISARVNLPSESEVVMAITKQTLFSAQLAGVSVEEILRRFDAERGALH